MIDVVIVNWNAGDHIRACIGGLAALPQASAPFRVTLVDNASTDNSLENLPVGGLDFQLIRNSQNSGFAAACNQGARAGKGEFILFLNPDTILRDAGALKLCADTFDSPASARVGICGVKTVDDAGNVARSSTRFPTIKRVFGWIFGLDRIFPAVFPTQFILENDHSSDATVDVVIGAFFFVRRTVFDKLGGFDERFFVYYEEVDFCRRALEMGFETRFLAGASVIHSGHGTTDNVRATRYFLVTRSRILYGLAHFPAPAALVLAVLTIVAEPLIRVAFFGLSGNFRAVAETLSGAAMVLRDAPRFMKPLRESS